MSLFFASFFFLYSALHFYILVKLKQAFHVRGAALWITGFLLAVMVAAPALVRLLEKADHEAVARGLAYAGYTWMAWAFLFFIVCAVFDIVRGTAYAVATSLEFDTTWSVGAGRLLTKIGVAVALIVVCYGWYEANTVRIERVVLRSGRIPANQGPVRVVQISDLHLGLTVGEWKLRRILEAVRRLNPHVLVVTGDIIDVQAHRLDGLSGLFRALDPPWGKYAVTGNHEFYAGIDSAEEFAEKAGLKLLRGETAAAGPFLTVTGIDDYVVQVYEPWRKNRWETELLRKAPAGAFRILLKHKPIVEQAALGIMELQLSGHTHKGQIFPFTLATRGAYKTYAGLYDLGKGSLLYVSRGTGTWGPPVRFLAPPEVTLVEIVGVQP